jgi:hypothetical protein
MNSRRRIGPPVDVHQIPAYSNSGSMLTGSRPKNGGAWRRRNTSIDRQDVTGAWNRSAAMLDRHAAYRRLDVMEQLLRGNAVLSA